MAEDVAATLEWYERVLDADVVATVPEGPTDDPLDWAQVSIDTVSLMFQSRESLSEELPALGGTVIGGSFTIYVDVNGFDELHHELLDAGAEIVLDVRETFYGRREFAITDCNGYVLWFGEKIGE